MEIARVLGRSMLEDGGETMGNATAEVPESSGDEETHESSAALAILVFLILLGVTMTVGHFLEKLKVSWMSEAGAALLLGIVMGYLGKVSGKSQTFHDWLSFQNNFFYFALLPPIIFEAAYSLDVLPFFSNIGAICAYAFIGTTMSAVLVGLTMYGAGIAGICFKLTLIEAFLFGSLISATDPVTVLAVFQRLHADYDLYILVFGESIFNDAVAIVLYSSLIQFQNESINAMAVLVGFGTFIEIFLCSMLIGVGCGLAASLVFRTKKLRNRHHPLEASLVVLFALSSFFIGEALSFSGIVAILFCGIAMSRYTRPNLTKFGERLSIGFFKTLATMSETFVFIYIGTSLFLRKEAWGDGMAWSFLFIALFALAHSRLANIQINTSVVNALRPKDNVIPRNHRFMLWFSGLRGAIAFALAIRAATDDFQGDKAPVGQVFLTTTFFIILLTVLINGGATSYLLNRLGLRSRNVSNYKRLGTLPRAGSETFSVDFDRSTRDGGMSEQTGENQSADWSSKSLLEKLRELNRAGVTSTLKQMDEQYLAKFFGTNVEMVERRRDELADGNQDAQGVYDEDEGDGPDDHEAGDDVTNDVTANGGGSGSHSPKSHNDKTSG